jgi:predicted lipoprotein with Yx(FWY)xxD motif
MIRGLLLLGAAGTLTLTACSSTHMSGSSAAPSRSSTSSIATPSSMPVGGTVTITLAETSKGAALAGPNGHVLYIYDADTATASNCTGGCALTWPPLVGTPKPSAGLDDSEFGTITRPDGSKQVTYDEHPLYYYGKDTDSKDVYGDGVDGMWHLAKTSSSESSPGSIDGY